MDNDEVTAFEREAIADGFVPPSSLIDELVYIDAHDQSAAAASAREGSKDPAGASNANNNDANNDANTDANSTDLDESVTIDANSQIDDLEHMSAASSISLATGGTHERTAYIPLRSDFVRMLADLATQRQEEGVDVEVSAEELLNHALRDLVQK